MGARHDNPVETLLLTTSKQPDKRNRGFLVKGVPRFPNRDTGLDTPHVHPKSVQAQRKTIQPEVPSLRDQEVRLLSRHSLLTVCEHHS